jgi:poly-beta-1,6-N-acetyl-D-glucosamine synthase
MFALEFDPTASEQAVEPPKTKRVAVALIPAHNEEDGIVATIRSLQTQTLPPRQIVVVSDNSTDRTVERARAAGATVIETVNNTAKKAGAINHGLRIFGATLADDDYVLCMDADGELSKQFIENALNIFQEHPSIGGLSGAIVARDPQNAIESAQAIEYARGTRLMGRAGGKVHVLSGACTIFPVGVLRHVARARGTELPGNEGEVFMEHSLTEDYELTLAIKKLGYYCTSTRRCPVTTDIMATRKMLEIQRLRWFRGAMESLWLYGWSRLTARIWLGVGFTFFASLMFPLALFIVAASWIAWGIEPVWYCLALFPLFLIESVVVSRRVSKRAQIVAWSFFPLWLYDNYMFILYWRALFAAVRGREKVWIT